MDKTSRQNAVHGKQREGIQLRYWDSTQKSHLSGPQSFELYKELQFTKTIAQGIEDAETKQGIGDDSPESLVSEDKEHTVTRNSAE